MAIIELTSVRIFANGANAVLAPVDLRLSAGDVVEVKTDAPDAAHALLKSLALMAVPESGEYTLEGAPMDPARYGQWLRGRRRIGYIGPMSALISNLSIRENLLLARSYYENRLDLDLADDVASLCNAFGVADKLDFRPSLLNPLDARIFIAIREVTKEAAILVVDNPEDLVGHPGFHLLMAHIQSAVDGGTALVFYTEGKNALHELTTRRFVIKAGILEEKTISLADRIEALR